jgi:hypothetical protein
MKTRFRTQPREWGIAVLILLLAAFSVPAQDFTLDWFTMDGGGGKSTGGVYAVTGTIGQPDAGTVAGGDYTLAGGFWGLVAALQISGAPLLSVTRTNGSVIVSWPGTAPSFVLEQTSQLLSPPRTNSWADVPVNQYQTVGTNIHFTISSPVDNQWFRLRRP